MKLLVDIYNQEHAYEMIDLGLDIVINIEKLSLTKEFNASLEQVKLIQDYALVNEVNVLVMLDKLYHEDDVKTLKKDLAQLNEIGIKTLIASDLSIINIVKQAGYAIKVINGNTTLNTNFHTMNTPANIFNGFMISNEINISEVFSILDHLDKTSILQGYGKQRIFYSKRQLLTSYYDYNKKDSIGFGIEDRLLISDYQTDENKSYIYEDESGTYIYTYYDVCALKYHETLMSKGLDYLYLNNLYNNQDIYNEVIGIYNALNKEELSSDEALMKLQTINSNLSESFLNDKTIFTIEEAKLLERENQ